MQLMAKVLEYSHKKDLSKEETKELYGDLIEDRMIYGNCYLDMEGGRVDPRDIDESKLK